MPVSSSDFLSLAQKQLLTSSTEIEYRNIVSLAYYASYHAIKPHLSRYAPDTHSKLIKYLCEKDQHKDEKISSSDLRSLGLLMDGMKKNRVYADYFLRKKFEIRDAKKSIASAKAFKNAFDEVMLKISQKQQA